MSTTSTVNLPRASIVGAPTTAVPIDLYRARPNPQQPLLHAGRLLVNFARFDTNRDGTVTLREVQKLASGPMKGSNIDERRLRQEAIYLLRAFPALLVAKSGLTMASLKSRVAKSLKDHFSVLSKGTGAITADTVKPPQFSDLMARYGPLEDLKQLLNEQPSLFKLIGGADGRITLDELDALPQAPEVLPQAPEVPRPSRLAKAAEAVKKVFEHLDTCGGLLQANGKVSMEALQMLSERGDLPAVVQAAVKRLLARDGEVFKRLAVPTGTPPVPMITMQSLDAVIAKGQQPAEMTRAKAIDVLLKHFDLFDTAGGAVQEKNGAVSFEAVRRMAGNTKLPNEVRAVLDWLLKAGGAQNFAPLASRSGEKGLLLITKASLEAAKKAEPAPKLDTLATGAAALLQRFARFDTVSGTVRADNLISLAGVRQLASRPGVDADTRSVANWLLADNGANFIKLSAPRGAEGLRFIGRASLEKVAAGGVEAQLLGAASRTSIL